MAQYRKDIFNLAPGPGEAIYDPREAERLASQQLREQIRSNLSQESLARFATQAQAQGAADAASNNRQSLIDDRERFKEEFAFKQKAMQTEIEEAAKQRAWQEAMSRMGLQVQVEESARERSARSAESDKQRTFDSRNDAFSQFMARAGLDMAEQRMGLEQDRFGLAKEKFGFEKKAYGEESDVQAAAARFERIQPVIELIGAEAIPLLSQIDQIDPDQSDQVIRKLQAVGLVYPEAQDLINQFSQRIRSRTRTRTASTIQSIKDALSRPGSKVRPAPFFDVPPEERTTAGGAVKNYMNALFGNVPR